MCGIFGITNLNASDGISQDVLFRIIGIMEKCER